MKNGILIREASNQDFRTISSVISAAFADQQNIRDGQIVQTLLFSELIKDGHDTVSLIAVDSKIVGHVLVSPVFLEPNNGLTCGQVSPLSVHPDFQSKGIGSSLMSAVIEKSKTFFDQLLLESNPAPKMRPLRHDHMNILQRNLDLSLTSWEHLVCVLAA